MNDVIIDHVIGYLGAKVMRHLSGGKDMVEFSYPRLNKCRDLLKNKGYSVRQIANAFYYLKKRKYVKMRREPQGRISLALTLFGAMRYLKKFPLVVLEKKLPSGTKSIIILSIPETKRALRDFLRLKLTRENFARPAKGIYVTDSRLCSHMVQFTEILDLKDYLTWGEFEQGQ